MCGIHGLSLRARQRTGQHGQLHVEVCMERARKNLSWLCQLQISYKTVQRDLELSPIVELRTSDWASDFASRVATLEIGTQRSVNSHS